MEAGELGVHGREQGCGQVEFRTCSLEAWTGSLLRLGNPLMDYIGRNSFRYSAKYQMFSHVTAVTLKCFQYSYLAFWVWLVTVSNTIWRHGLCTEHL